MPGAGRRFWPGDDAWAGSAIVMWSGVDLKPRNLFDRTPFYPYPAPPPAPQARVRGAEPNEDDPRGTGAAAVEAAPNRPAPDQKR